MLQYGNKTNAWELSENVFDIKGLKRVESLFHQANGYLGIRASAEEIYLHQQRGTYVAGTFDKFDEHEVTELPNVPDCIFTQLEIDGEHLSLQYGTYCDYQITLNLRTAELIRTFTYTTKTGAKVACTFQRIVSKANRHIVAQKVTLSSDRNVTMKIQAGIDGSVTNSGVQHFRSGPKRLHGKQIMQASYTTNQSHIDFSLFTGHRFLVNKEAIWPNNELLLLSRSIEMIYTLELNAGQTLSFEKVHTIHTSRDLEFSGRTIEDINKKAFETVTDALSRGYDALCEESAVSWTEFWKTHDVIIDSDNPDDQIILRYAILEIAMMTPQHDNRMNIGAKGLSGEAYKGHTFWDTEIFLLPFWIMSDPIIARKLLEYRYLSLDGARDKARANGYFGAMFPWESAWIEDGETTPEWGAADVVTGESLPIECGNLEQHITSDVAYGVWHYYTMSGDDEFMERYGYRLIFETAIFWVSRWEWNEARQRYEITDVIGPDEYSEHVSNNAFTNYMSYWNVALAIRCYETLQQKQESLLEHFERELSLSARYAVWQENLNKLYLPQLNEELILPQDDEYLKLPEIPVAGYKESRTRSDIIKDYNMKQISKLQVSKQADVLVLQYLLPELFTHEVIKKNFTYYEAHCLHDSSLSFSTHAVMASRAGEPTLARTFFEKACHIDLNDNPSSSAAGIHAASMGGIYQAMVNGLGGLALCNETLTIQPQLPEGFRKISYRTFWKGVRLEIMVETDRIVVTPERHEKHLEIFCDGKAYQLDGSVTINRNNRGGRES